MTSWLTTAGFTDIRLHALPSAPEAKGPGLFVARATKNRLIWLNGLIWLDRLDQVGVGDGT